MRGKWLKFVLKITNRIYNKKQSIIGEEGIKVLSDVFLLFFLELLLAVVSFPLYLGLKPAKVTAYFEEEGGYKKIAYDYNLRRILTLTSASVIFFIWFIKFLVILLTPNVYGPLKLYSVTNFEPIDILQRDLVVAETEIQTSKVNDFIKKPEILTVEKIKGGNYVFYGKGQPLSMVVLFLSDKQTAIYTDQVDKDGNWKVDYTQKGFQLKEGNHEIVSFCYNKEKGERSKVSDAQYFKVKTSFLDKLVQNVDIFINITITLVIFLGIFLIILTI